MNHESKGTDGRCRSSISTEVDTHQGGERGLESGLSPKTWVNKSCISLGAKGTIFHWERSTTFVRDVGSFLST